MRTRYCKFGIDCKFSHPQPYSHGSLFSKSGVSSVYPPIVSSMTSPPGMSLIGGGIPSWPPTRPFWVSPGSWMPMLLPCGQQDWNSYTVSYLLNIKYISKFYYIYDWIQKSDWIYYHWSRFLIIICFCIIFLRL